MALILCLTLHVVLSDVSGLDVDVWRIEKRLSSLQELNIHIQKENANLRSILSEIQRENKLLKRELKNVVERVDKCKEAILRQDDHTQRTLEKGSVTRKPDDDLEIFSGGNGHPNPRIGERAMESKGSADVIEILTKENGQPVPRLGK